MGNGYLGRDIQPQAKALFRGCRFQSREGLEKCRQNFWRNRLAAIADAQFEVAVVAAHVDLHRIARAAMRHGIRDEITEELTQPFRIGGR